MNAALLDDDRPACAVCGASIDHPEHCWRCGGDPLAPRTRVDGLGPEPKWRGYEITRPAVCHGCGEQFTVAERDRAGDVAKAFRLDGDGPWRRYHIGCCPWSR